MTTTTKEETRMPAARREIQQWTARQDRDNLSLIPPLAEEFSVYGGKDTTERARKWALRHRYLLAQGVPACAHGLYLLSMCPGRSTCRNHFQQLDHADIWVPYVADDEEGIRRPFILSHPYADDITDETGLYGHAHGLDIASYRDSWLADGWYSDSTIPIRMTVHQEYPVWPIEEKAALLLRTQPVAWPEEEA